MALTLTITGSEALTRALLALGDRAPQAASGALYREAERIMAASKELVPVDTGALKGSGHVALPEISGTAVTVEMGYGGPAVNYAVFVRENLLAVHPSGMAKYLERPLFGHEDGMADRLAADIRPVIEESAA